MCLAGALIISALADLNAQASTVLLREDCAGCTITLSLVQTIAETDAAPFVANPTVLRDRQGRLFVVPLAGRHQIAIYPTPMGPPITLGGSGTGPGEFGRIDRAIITPGDSLLVIDLDTARETIFSPSFKFVRSSVLPAMPNRMVFAVRGARVFVGPIRSRERFGHPFHIVDSNGALERSFGEAESLGPEFSSIHLVRAVTARDSQTFWSSQRFRYELEVWRFDGSLEKRYRRDASWFPPGAPPPVGADVLTSRPRPEITGLQQTPNRLLWTLATVPVVDWKPSAAESREVRQELVHPSVRIIDRVLEVVDPDRGTVLATLRIPGHYVQFVYPDMIYSVREGPAGRTFIDLWRTELTHPGRNR